MRRQMIKGRMLLPLAAAFFMVDRNVSRSRLSALKAWFPLRHPRRAGDLNFSVVLELKLIAQPVIQILLGIPDGCA
jgi:hypothetical protein